MIQKQQCEQILDVLLPFVEVTLKKYGEFYPVGAVLTTDNEKSITALETDEKKTKSQEVIDNLIEIHQDMANKNEIIASGIAYCSSIDDPEHKYSLAIVVTLEHKDDYSVVVGLPYKIGLFKRVQFGEMFALKGNQNIFKNPLNEDFYNFIFSSNSFKNSTINRWR